MKALLSGLMLLLFLSGCALTGFHTKNGGAFISDFTESDQATSHSAATKMGEACSKNILGVYSSGDSSIEAAKKNGNITTVSSVDTKIFAVRPFYGSVCTIVRGN